MGITSPTQTHTQSYNLFATQKVVKYTYGGRLIGNQFLYVRVCLLWIHKVITHFNLRFVRKRRTLKMKTKNRQTKNQEFNEEQAVLT